MAFVNTGAAGSNRMRSDLSQEAVEALAAGDPRTVEIAVAEETRGARLLFDSRESGLVGSGFQGPRRLPAP